MCLSFFLKVGFTDAVLSFSEKQSLFISLLTILVRCKLMMFAENLKIFGGI